MLYRIIFKGLFAFIIPLSYLVSILISMANVYNVIVKNL